MNEEEKAEINMNKEMTSASSKQVLPDWLPHDWYICQDFDNPQPPVYYSCPKGKKFYSKDEVIEYLAYQAKSKKIKRKITKEVNKEKKLPAKNATQVFAQPPLLCPDWLPLEWYIERDYEDLNDVWYCTPKGRKFRSKDEVLHYLAKSNKASKQKRKILKS